MRERFYYDMARMEVKEDKFVSMGGQTSLDYDELTVTDDDFAEEERERFQKFL